MEEGVVTGVHKAEATPLGACLVPLLKALNWHGTRRQLSEAMPHFSQIHNTAMFCDVMERLNYFSEALRMDLNNLDDRLLPCLFVSHQGRTLLLLRREKDAYVVFDGEKNQETTLTTAPNDSSLVGVVNVFKKKMLDEKEAKLEDGWLRKTFNANKSLIYSVIALSFFVNLFALATPLFIMATYDKVIGASSQIMLGEFVVGITLAFSGYYILYRLRAKLLAVVGARFDRAIGNNVFERLLYLAPIYTESATVGSQVARIKDFDRLRQFVTGPMIVTFCDLPFIFIALSIIAIIGGSLIIIPILVILVFIIIGLIMRLKVKRLITQSGFRGSQQQEFILESIKGVKTIKELAIENTWAKRFREYSAAVSMLSIKTTVLNATTNAIADFMMIGSGLAILSFGAIKVINQTLTVGGIIAVMILIWRALGPLKTLFNALVNLQQVENSVQQIARLMKIEIEIPTEKNYASLDRRVRGFVTFDRVSLRYRAAYDPALIGISFEVTPGELVGVVGRNGSGKSTLLKVLLGLYAPQAGSIRVDHQDIRQINSIELRSIIGYLPQYPELFYGTIEANLRLAAPDATQEEMEQAAAMAGVLADIKALPKGFNTRIKDYSGNQLSVGLQQRLCLARTYLKKARIILLDEPGNMLDKKADQQLIQTLKYLRGKASVIVVTHRPSHLKMMDKILLLEQGQLIMRGPTQKVFPKIPEGFL